MTPRRRDQLLAMAAERVPLLRAELEFWQHLLLELGVAPPEPDAPPDFRALAPRDGADPP